MQGRITQNIIIVVLIVAAVAAFLIVGRLNAQPTGEQPPQSKTPEEAAEQSLEILRKLVTEENFRAMGFETLEEVSNAELGEPMSVFRVPHDQLLKYEPQESDPERLLVDVSRIMYPVIVDGKVRSSVVVEGPEGQWVGTDFGGPNLMQTLAKFRGEESDFVVHVPFLGLYFIANEAEDGLALTPIIDDTRFDFVAGRTLRADQVFEAILPAAKEYDGEAPM